MLAWACLAAGCGSDGGPGEAVVAEAYRKNAEELPSAERMARVAGLPLSPEEWVRRSAPADAENGAVALRAVLAQLPEGGREDRATLQRALADGDLDAADALLARWNPALAATAEALARPAFDWRRSWDTEKPADVTMPEYLGTTELVAWAGFRAERRIRRGDADGALADLRLAVRLAEAVESDGVWIAGLVGLGHRRVAADAAVRAIAFRPDDRAFRRAAVEVLATEPTADDALRTLRGESLFVAAGDPGDFLEDPYHEAEPGERAGYAPRPRGLSPEVVARASRTVMLRAFMSAAIDVREAARRGGDAARDEALRQLVGKPPITMPGRPYELTAESRTATSGIAQSFLGRIAHARNLRALVQALDRADPAAPFEAPADPWDAHGAALRTIPPGLRAPATSAEPWLIWSVGPNGRDDFGRVDDLLLRFPPAPPAASASP